eukprot:PhM_4_TR13646/c0_g1_i1/m.33615
MLRCVSPARGAILVVSVILSIFLFLNYLSSTRSRQQHVSVPIERRPTTPVSSPTTEFPFSFSPTSLVSEYREPSQNERTPKMWRDGELVLSHEAKCSALTTAQRSEQRLSFSSHGRIIVPKLDPSVVMDGDAVVVFVMAVGSDGLPRCVGGDVFDVRLQSYSKPDVTANSSTTDDSHILLSPQDALVDLGNGLYELSFVVPSSLSLFKDGFVEIEICADLLISNVAATDLASRSPDVFIYNLSISKSSDAFDLHKLGYRTISHKDVKEALKGTGGAASCKESPRTYSEWRARSCTPKGSGVLLWSKRDHNNEKNLTQCSAAQNDILHNGHWRKDDPGHSLWYYPRSCRLRRFSPSEAKQCLAGKWVVAWGDSTLKQALANFVEETMGIPIFYAAWNKSLPIFMKDIVRVRNSVSGSKRKHMPNFFSYRQWDRSGDTTLAAARFSMAWGGCQGGVSYPLGCTDAATRNRRYLKTLFFGGVSSDGVRHGVPRRLPDVIVMSHHIWFSPILSEAEFVESAVDAIQWLIGVYKEKGQAPPVLIWQTATKVSADELNRCRLPSETFFSHHRSKLLKKAFNAHNLSVVWLDRWSLTFPFHVSFDGYAHTGVHYGASRGMCMTGLTHKALYDPSTCTRKTTPDDVLPQVWLNLIC